MVRDGDGRRISKDERRLRRLRINSTTATSSLRTINDATLVVSDKGAI